MGTKYSTQAVSGYNATPPADDGTVNDSNKVKWSTVKNKIGDPLDTWAAAVDAALVAAFNYTALGKTDSYTITAADNAKTIEIASSVSSAITIKLPDAATVGAGYYVHVKNLGSVTCTIGRVTSGDTIDGTAADSSIGTLDLMTFRVNSTTDGYLQTTAIVGAYLPLAGGTMSGDITSADNLIIRPEIKDYSITHNSVASSSGTLTLDYSTGQSFTCTLTENITTVTVSNPPASGKYGELVLRLVQHASAAKTVTWAAAYLFPGGTDHVMSTGLSSIDYVILKTIDGGTTWYCDFSNGYA